MLNRRFQLYLPYPLIDGMGARPKTLTRTLEDLRKRFPRSLLWFTGVENAHLSSDGISPESSMLVIDVEDSTANYQFFREFKRALADRFGQIEIYVVSHPIEIV